MADINQRVPGCDNDGAGERGERGKRGPRGHRGHRGQDGNDGNDGNDGSTGPTGPTGMSGSGSTGPTGPAGGGGGSTGPTGPTGGGGEIDVERDGAAVVSSADTLNFIGTRVIDAGGGEAVITPAVIFDSAVGVPDTNIRGARLTDQSPIDNTQAQITNLGSQDGTVDPAAAGAIGYGSTIGGGNDNSAIGDYSTVPGGSGNIASGLDSYAEGFGCQATGPQSHAEGALTIASGPASGGSGGFGALGGAHAEGFHTVASGVHSHAEGTSGEAAGNASHSEGAQCFAYAHHSHAEGEFTTAGDPGDPSAGAGAHAEGSGTEATGPASHAENYGDASGDGAHAEGFSTASGALSHAGGQANGFVRSVASGFRSFAHNGEAFADASIAVNGSSQAAGGIAMGGSCGPTALNSFACAGGTVGALAGGTNAFAQGGTDPETLGFSATFADGVSSHASGINCRVDSAAYGARAAGGDANATRPYQDVYACRTAGNASNTQTSKLVMGRQNTGLAPNQAIELKFGLNGSQFLSLEDDRAYVFTIAAVATAVIGVQVSRGWTFAFSAHRDGGVSVISGAGPVDTYGDAPADWQFVAAVAAGPDRIALTFTIGAVAVRANCVARVEFTEVATPAP